jgi:hypothetical protein
MESEVRLKFRYSEKDYVRAVRSHYKSRLRLKLDAFVILFTLAVGIHFLRSPGSHLFGIGLIAMSCVLAAVLVAAFGVIPYVQFRTQKKLHDEYVLVFSCEGIHFRTADIDSRLEWSLYNEALIDPHSYLLYYGSRQFTVIPKSAFEDSQQLLAFNNLLEEKIAKIVRKDSPARSRDEHS